jgi:hypothetical protein
VSDTDDVAADAPSRGLSTEAGLFAGVGAATFAIFLVYAIAADDDTGKVLLGLTALFSLIMAGYLWFRDRRGGVELDDAEVEPTDEGLLWFPESSLWPFALAGGGALVIAGLTIGPWLWIPGGLLMIRALWGLASQSRARE